LLPTTVNASSEGEANVTEQIKQGRQASHDGAISRSTFLKAGAATAGATLAATAGSGLAGATIKNEAPFNITGRAMIPLTFAVWGGAADLAPLVPIMKKFSDRNPGINVKLTTISAQGWAALFEVLLTRIAAGNAPDITRVAIEGMALFGSKNLALPMNDFMKRDSAYTEELRNDTAPAMWKALSYKGMQLALPFSYDNMMVWYRTDLIKRPARNWTGDDFLALCAQLKKQGKYGTNLWQGGLFGLEVWSLSAGANLLSADWSKSTALDKGNLVAWELMNDLVNKYHYAPRPTANFPEASFFESGRLGTFLAGRWPLQQLLLDKFPSPKMDVQFFPILGGGPRKQIFGIDGFPIIKSCKYPEAAWKLAKFMSSKEVMTDFMRNGQDIPCRRSLAYAGWMNPPAHYRDFYDSLGPAATPVTAPPQYNEVDTAVTKWYTEMLSQQVTPKAALTGLDKDLTAILSKPV
jgi:ABC-type glycerol-3-phosphate transport system substrate-binding protein